ncbi:MAG: hypothetical protein ABIY52_11695 [Gemmatimonadaceae bacterium]
MEVSTPVRVTLPREAFTLDIVAIPGTQEAVITNNGARKGTPAPRSFTSRVFTPMHVERARLDAPLTVQGARIESRRVP